MITLLAGAGLARVVGLLSIPILTRLYSPEDFAVLGLYMALIAVLMPIMTLRYSQAVPLPKTDVMAFNLFSVCFKLIIIFSVVLYFLFAIWGERIFAIFDMGELFPWWWLVVLGVSGSAFYELFSLWATRKRSYRVIAKTQFAQSIIGSAVKVVMGLLAIKPFGLILGQFLSQTVGIGGFLRDARKDFKSCYPRVTIGKEMLVAKYYQSFVWYRLPSQFLMAFSVQAPVMMMASLYGKELTGQLSLAIMAISLPVGLIGGAMAKAYYAEIALLGKGNVGKISKLTVSVQKRLFSIGLPVAAASWFLAEPLFVFVFGQEWSVAGEYAAILSPYILLQFTSAPLVQAINVLGSQASFLIINIMRFLGLAVIYFFSKKLELSGGFFVCLVGWYLFFYYMLISLFIFLIIDKVGRRAETS